MTTFEELAAKRRAYVEAARDNGFEEGLRKLLADLYPDNAHFIYELLQNAEDAGALEVTFVLRHDGLRVEHDGPKLFNLRDINSITGIGQSTKADDATSIGKFGVGFKAVFAYTQSPVVYSGEHSFAILDLFVPTRVQPSPGTRPGVTAFWFPFDRSEKPAELAVAEVAKALHEISRSTLLFLNNIRLIECSFPDGDRRILGRSEVAQRVIAIDSAHEQDAPSYWYRITGNVPIGDKEYPVAAAFALDPSQETKPGKQTQPERVGKAPPAARPGFTVRPVDGQVFIYFPAVKETSGLKFHIHAPFASTVARDSVRDDDGNDELVSGIANLIAVALPEMRDAGLMNEGLLAALPNNDDDPPGRYVVIREQVLAAFRDQPITPMMGGGGYCESTELLRSVSAIRAALSPEDVQIMRSLAVGDDGGPYRGWLPERDGRPRVFLDSLDAPDFGADELAEILDRVGEVHAAVEERREWGIDDGDELLPWFRWISGKDDKWLRGFYAALGRLTQQSSNPYGRSDRRYWSWSDPLPDTLAAAPIVRVQRGAGVEHVLGQTAYMPGSPGLRADGLVVDGVVAFSQSESKADKQETNALQQFFSHAGVRAWDAAAQLDVRFASYQEGVAPNLQEHFEDLRTLMELLDDKSVAAVTYADRKILLGSEPNGGFVWSTPKQIYLDEPYGATGLSALYESDAFKERVPRPLASEYLWSDVDIAALSRRLGARSAIQITQADPAAGNPEFSWNWVDRENYNRTSRDWSIELFEEIVATEDETLLRALWRVVVAAPSDRADAVYRANNSRKQNVMRSQLLQKLTSVPWILDQHGNLRRPEDVTPADLDEQLHVPADAPLLTRAGFGKRAADERGERAEADKAAQRFGFETSDELARLGELRRRCPGRFKELMDQLETAEVSLPEGSSLAPDQRARRSAESAVQAPGRRYEKRVRSVYVQEPGHLSAARGYLRELYTNDDGVFVCQACSSEMPFKINGDYYFEAVQFVKDAERDLQENRLALCPTCAAKYRHARETSLSDLRDDLLTQTVGRRGSITVEVTLAGDDCSLRFVGKHAVDLQAALEATAGSLLREDDADVPEGGASEGA